MNADAIFDAFDEFSKHVHLLDKVRALRTERDNCLSRRCGNCYYWMKRECEPEELHGLKKSCNDYACNLFNLAPMSRKIADEKQRALNELEISV